ncbi:MAG: cysteine desulfurase family protein [Patescibacteria group bacterium]
MKSIYLDHAATTYLDPRVKRAMEPFWDKEFGNPSSFHSVGKRAKEAVDAARGKIAEVLGCRESEIIFTMGGTESDNLAIFGVTKALEKTGKHIITSKIEHPAVWHSCEKLEKDWNAERSQSHAERGGRVSYIKVNRQGIIDLKELEAAITPETVLVSIMYANNEIGTIEPIREIAKIIRQKREEFKTKHPYFHTDACQAAGALEMNVAKLGADLLTFNGSKIYGPKGIGALYIKTGTPLTPILYGGGQERGYRSGTENVPAIIGLAEALKLTNEEKEKENARLIKLRDYLIENLLKIPKTILNGHPTLRLPNNVNISFMDIEGEAMVLYLDSYGIYGSTGSACQSATLEPSHVIRAIGLPYEAAHGSLRLTLGRRTTKADLDYLLKILPEIVGKLRAISPVKLNMKHYQ